MSEAPHAQQRSGVGSRCFFPCIALLSGESITTNLLGQILGSKNKLLVAESTRMIPAKYLTIRGSTPRASPRCARVAKDTSKEFGLSSQGEGPNPSMSVQRGAPVFLWSTCFNNSAPASALTHQADCCFKFTTPMCCRQHTPDSRRRVRRKETGLAPEANRLWEKHAGVSAIYTRSPQVRFKYLPAEPCGARLAETSMQKEEEASMPCAFVRSYDAPWND